MHATQVFVCISTQDCVSTYVYIHLTHEERIIKASSSMDARTCCRNTASLNAKQLMLGCCSLSALHTVVPVNIHEAERLELSSVWVTICIKA